MRTTTYTKEQIGYYWDLFRMVAAPSHWDMHHFLEWLGRREKGNMPLVKLEPEGDGHDPLLAIRN